MLSLVVVGRAWYDRRHRENVGPLGERARRLVRRATRETRTDWGRWRRVAALQLARTGPSSCDASSPAAGGHRSRSAVRRRGREVARRRRRRVGDRAPARVASARARARSRVASQLERLAPAPGPKLLPLLRDPEPRGPLLGSDAARPYPGDRRVGPRRADPGRRRERAARPRSRRWATAEVQAQPEPPSCCSRTPSGSCASTLPARPAGQRAQQSGPGAHAPPRPPTLVGTHGGEGRTARSGTRGDRGAAARADLTDEFARNGAAEILQDIGFVDHLVLEAPGSPLLAADLCGGRRQAAPGGEERAVEQTTWRRRQRDALPAHDRRPRLPRLPAPHDARLHRLHPRRSGRERGAPARAWERGLLDARVVEIHDSRQRPCCRVQRGGGHRIVGSVAARVRVPRVRGDRRERRIVRRDARPATRVIRD